MTGPLSRGVCRRRISVVGTSGSGKTTTVAQIVKRLGIPHVEMDALCCRAPVLAARDASVDRRIIIQTVPDQR